MKKIELRHIIKEEIHKILKEEQLNEGYEYGVPLDKITGLIQIISNHKHDERDKESIKLQKELIQHLVEALEITKKLYKRF